MADRKQGKGSRRSRNEWRSVLAKFEDSTMGVEAFCRHEAISEASFYRWRRLLDNASDGAKVVCSDTAPAFVDLGTLNGQSALRPQLDLRVDLGEGLVLHLVRN